MSSLSDRFSEPLTNATIQCASCRRFFDADEDFSCEAFPEGIPLSITQGQHNHEKPFPGDDGLLFVPIRGLGKDAVTFNPIGEA